MKTVSLKLSYTEATKMLVGLLREGLTDEGKQAAEDKLLDFAKTLDANQAELVQAREHQIKFNTQISKLEKKIAELTAELKGKS